ncbi:type II 3-dehydroquinate dehydratase [Thalassotalea atypica]|uniref:type II 3-dehydroquinate dehydratase n=1 Tax=Thalassotalea atypica TaxID=2054316 RepID=UPI0025740E17|nr:type II 3-dehydroquinate dehydratase [Thalassotalea atypica]
MTTKSNILVINGPNLNMLGKREPEVYGDKTLADVMACLQTQAGEFGLMLEHFQSNHEGEIIDRLHQAFQSVDFVIINPAALTHTSVALRDAILAIDVPFIEVHISNVHAREQFRHQSYLSDIAVGVICGLGISGYQYALRAASQWLAEHKE